MCGRYKVSTSEADLLAAFHAHSAYVEGTVKARYNVAPTDQVPVVRVELTPALQDQTRRVLLPMRWGLIPFWAQDEKIGSRLLNARIETLHEKPMFRDALLHKRCLVVADGFYEWRRTGPKAKDKQPYLFSFSDARPFAFAGLWSTWRSPAGSVDTCTVITTVPNALMRPFHDRMPVMFDPLVDDDAITAWLDPHAKAIDLSPLMQPPDRPGFVAQPVSVRVGNVKYDEPALAEPIRLLFDDLDGPGG